MVYLLVGDKSANGDESAWCSHPTNKVVQEKNRVMGHAVGSPFIRESSYNSFCSLWHQNAQWESDYNSLRILCHQNAWWIEVRLLSSTARSDVCLFCNVNHNHTHRKWNTREDPIFLTDWEHLCLDVAKWRVSLCPRVTTCYEFYDRTWTTQYSWPI